MSDFDLELSIEDALRLFEASRARTTPLGAQVAAVLRDYQHASKIKFLPLEPNEYGSSNDDWLGRIIRVNIANRDKIPEVSLTVVHEGVHRSQKSAPIDQELACRELQVDYYQELLLGITFQSLKDGIMRLSIGPDSDPVESRTSAQWRSRNQLVDYILNLDLSDRLSYRKSLTADWVRQHIDDWNGLPNRWASTRGMYLAVLAEDRDSRDLILKILESVGSPAEWNDLEKAAGGFAQTRQALQGTYNAPVMGPRIKTLERRWNVSLAPGGARW